MTDATCEAERSAGRTGARPAESLLWQSGVAILVLVPLTLAALAGEERLLNGINLWMKPLKFQLSVALHLGTLALLLRLVAVERQDRGWVRAAVRACVVSAIFEVVYITLQAGRGRHSHFNDSTMLEQVLYGVMGAGAVTLVVTAALIGVLIWRCPRVGLGPGLRWGASWGLILGSVATFVVAGYMSNAGGHWVGGAPSDTAGLPIFGWARDGGDLRVPHFFATHLMQVLPLVGLAADRWSSRPVTAVCLTAAAGVTITVATFFQALAGQPFLG